MLDPFVADLTKVYTMSPATKGTSETRPSKVLLEKNNIVCRSGV